MGLPPSIAMSYVHRSSRMSEAGCLKQDAQPKQKGNNCQSVLLFSGSHNGYCPDSNLIWDTLGDYVHHSISSD